MICSDKKKYIFFFFNIFFFYKNSVCNLMLGYFVTSSDQFFQFIQDFIYFIKKNKKLKTIITDLRTRLKNYLHWFENKT